MDAETNSHELAQLMDTVVRDTAEMKGLKSQTKELNDKINTNKRKLMEMMKENGTNQITLHNTVLRLTKKKRVKAPSVNDVFETVEEHLKENETTADICEDLVDEIKNKIDETREETEIESLSFSKAK